MNMPRVGIVMSQATFEQFNSMLLKSSFFGVRADRRGRNDCATVDFLANAGQGFLDHLTHGSFDSLHHVLGTQPPGIYRAALE